MFLFCLKKNLLSNVFSSDCVFIFSFLSLRQTQLNRNDAHTSRIRACVVSFKTKNSLR